MPAPPATEYGFFGWKEFRRNRTDVLLEYDRAKDYNTSRPMQTAHGTAGEAALRQWLGDFLPKRYSVTSGYIIPDVIVPEYTLLHYDVIIYDAVNAPTLWIDSDYDDSSQARKRAIPAKYVRSVFEVKASLTPRSASEALAKLSELNHLAKHLPDGFSSNTFFFELALEAVENQQILPNLIPTSPIVGYWGGVVLRCHLDDRMTALVNLIPPPERKQETVSAPIPLAPILFT